MFKKYLVIPLVALGLIFGNPLLSSRKRTKRTIRPRKTKRPATKKIVGCQRLALKPPMG